MSGEKRLRDVLQADDGQVAAPLVPLPLQLDLDSGPPSDERLRLRARRSSRPTIPLLESRLALGGYRPRFGCLPARGGAAALSAIEVVRAERSAFRNP
jgi:hypothetical protein